MAALTPVLHADSATSRAEASRLLLVVLLLIFATAVLTTAWVSDDAYITFRTLDNFVHGYGLRWNVGERVQSFTDPLWLLLLSIPYALTREAYFTSLVVSIPLAFAAVWLFATRIARSPLSAALGLLALIFSKAFVEYSTSGLENSLTHLLLAVFLALVCWSDRARRLLALWCVGALIMVNRLDLVLLVGPVLAVDAVGRPWRDIVRTAAIGLTPLVAWEIFSIVYYGFPFPNTAYAKLGTGVSSMALLVQGGLYLLDTMENDPVTLVTIGAATVMALRGRQRGNWAVAIGILLYLAYVVRVGGDFMSGRFLTPPFFAAVGVFARQTESNVRATAAPIAASIILQGMFATTRPPITSTSRTFATVAGDAVSEGGIADERAFYYQWTGLLRWSRQAPLPTHRLVSDGLAMRGTSDVVKPCDTGWFLRILRRDFRPYR